MSKRWHVHRIRQRWLNYGPQTASSPPTSLIQIPFTFFSSIMFPTVDSSAAALAAAFLFLTCLPQQR